MSSSASPWLCQGDAERRTRHLAQGGAGLALNLAACIASSPRGGFVVS